MRRSGVCALEVRGRGWRGVGDENGGAAHAAPRQEGGLVVGGVVADGQKVVSSGDAAAAADRWGRRATRRRRSKVLARLRCGVQSGWQNERRRWSGKQARRSVSAADVNSSSEDVVTGRRSRGRGSCGLRWWWCRWTGRRAGDDGWASFETLSTALPLSQVRTAAVPTSSSSDAECLIYWT